MEDIKAFERILPVNCALARRVSLVVLVESACVTLINVGREGNPWACPK